MILSTFRLSGKLGFESWLTRHAAESIGGIIIRCYLDITMLVAAGVAGYVTPRLPSSAARAARFWLTRHWRRSNLLRASAITVDTLREQEFPRHKNQGLL